jgi:hypothetical protein
MKMLGNSKKKVIQRRKSNKSLKIIQEIEISLIFKKKHVKAQKMALHSCLMLNRCRYIRLNLKHLLKMQFSHFLQSESDESI